MKSSRLADPDPTIDRVFQRGNPPGRAQKERKKERKSVLCVRSRHVVSRHPP